MSRKVAVYFHCLSGSKQLQSAIYLLDSIGKVLHCLRTEANFHTQFALGQHPLNESESITISLQVPAATV